MILSLTAIATAALALIVAGKKRTERAETRLHIEALQAVQMALAETRAKQKSLEARQKDVEMLLQWRPL